MPKRTAVDMQLPHVKELDIVKMSIYLWLNLVVDERDA
jgi:hypothetical protein